jgi:hypothetical protein
MKDNQSSEAVFARHPQKPKGEDLESEQYPGVSVIGVEKTKASTDKLVKIIDDLKPGSIFFIGGASDLARTKSAGEIYGDTLAEHYADDMTVKVVTLTNMEDLLANKKKSSITAIKKLIAANKDKKLIITYPVISKDFGLFLDFLVKDEKNPKNEPRNDYTNALIKLGNNGEAGGADALLRSGGKITIEDKTIEGTPPKKIAERHMHRIKRLQAFAQRFAPNQKIVTFIVGHSWTLDALASYLANNGKADVKGWEKIGGTMIDVNEMGKLTINGDGTATFFYRDKEYDVPPELLESTPD